MGLLRRRVSAEGFQVVQFRYRSLKCSPSENAEKLFGFVQKLPARRIHFVAHSLGGIVLAHYFHCRKEHFSGRVVLLGSPLNTSSAARSYASYRVTRPLLGKSIEAGLLGDHSPWDANVEAGMVAGTRGIGVGSLLFGALPKPNDGTVALVETRVEGLRDFICVPESHFSMLLSRQVANETVGFLRSGHFSPAAGREGC